MKRATRLFAVLVVVVLGCFPAKAQQIPLPPATPPASPVPRPGNSVVVYLPNPVKVDGTLAGDGGSAGGIWSAVIAAIASCIVACITALLAYLKLRADIDDSKKNFEIDVKRLQDETDKSQREMAQARQDYDLDVKKFQEATQQFKLRLAQDSEVAAQDYSIKQRTLVHQIETDLKDRGVAEGQALESALRLVHEQKMTEAKLVASFADQLFNEK
jgi:hypothetical protein